MPQAMGFSQKEDKNEAIFEVMVLLLITQTVFHAFCCLEEKC